MKRLFEIDRLKLWVSTELLCMRAFTVLWGCCVMGGSAEELEALRAITHNLTAHKHVLHRLLACLPDKSVLQMPTTSALDLGGDDSTETVRLHQLHICVLSPLSFTPVLLRPIRLINPLCSPLHDEPVLLNQHKMGKHTVLQTLL